MIVSTATAGAGKYVQIGVGVVYFLSDSKGNIDSSIKLSSELKKENALKYATYVEEERKGIAEKTYYGEVSDLGSLFTSYVNGKMSTQKEVSEYNKIRRTNYSLNQINTRLWRAHQYSEKGNPDYYVVPRRISSLPEIENIWKRSGK